MFSLNLPEKVIQTEKLIQFYFRGIFIFREIQGKRV